MVELWLYARSHFAKGMEIVLLLVVYLAYGFSTRALSYILLTISSWFLAISWLFAPYLFNPSGFERVEDFRDWTNWLLYRGGIGVKGEESWEAWWDEELIYLLDTHLFYTIISSICGFLLGAKERLGEIRSLDVVQKLFERFPAAFMDTLHVPLGIRCIHLVVLLLSVGSLFSNQFM
ncbi:unnamed protein product [Cuscuta campestris]|uniref:Glycosyl transferase 48 domain-containing protein n=1 Tax=Cuscuta campestris TaxID=132261 RepID=A0A484MC76_9ASTE|nr:unnamed protein product [Cuscuta campestris]